MYVPFDIGAVLAARYRVDAILGEGPTGPLFRATDLHLATLVTVRLFRPDLADDDARTEAFLADMRRASKVKSPHLVAILDIGRLEVGAPYVVKEHLEGAHLGEVSKARGALPVHLAARWIRQAALGIAAAHQHGLIHGDIRPDNIFLAQQVDGPEVVKVLELGGARSVSVPPGADETTHVLGTAERGAKAPTAGTVDGRQDLFALVGIFAKLVTGNMTWGTEHLQEGSKPFSSSVLKPLPTNVADILMRMAARHEPGGIGTVQALADALKALTKQAVSEPVITAPVPDDEEETSLDFAPPEPAPDPTPEEVAEKAAESTPSDVVIPQSKRMTPLMDKSQLLKPASSSSTSGVTKRPSFPPAPSETGAPLSETIVRPTGAGNRANLLVLALVLLFGIAIGLLLSFKSS